MSRTRTTLLALAATGAIFTALHGCTPAPDAVAERPPLADGAAYLTAVRSDPTVVRASDTDDTLLQAGGIICRAADDGATVEDLAIIVNDSGVGQVRGAHIAAAAVVFLCPEHRTALGI